jgi:hypothetical protein
MIFSGSRVRANASARGGVAVHGGMGCDAGLGTGACDRLPHEQLAAAVQLPGGPLLHQVPPPGPQIKGPLQNAQAAVAHVQHAAPFLRRRMLFRRGLEPRSLDMSVRPPHRRSQARPAAS